MISKREFFEFNPNATEKDWENFSKQMDEIEEKMWEQDHPLDV